MAVARGDRFVWAADGQWLDAVSIEVGNVAKDGTWANLRCTGPGGKTWGKRQALPLPDSFRAVADA